MGRIKEPLQQMGATVELLGAGETAPIRIGGSELRGIEYELPVASAQVKSCVLLAGLFADGETVVIEPRPTRDHTERLLQAMNVDLVVDGTRIVLRGCGPDGHAPPARSWVVPGDFSSAAFLMLAAAGKPGVSVTIEGVGLNPRRTAFLDVLGRMGAIVQAEPRSGQDEPEPIGDITMTGNRLTATEVGGDEVPALIDELPLAPEQTRTVPLLSEDVHALDALARMARFVFPESSDAA